MYFLGIDVGTGGTRALIISESGAVIGSATEEHEPFASPRIRVSKPENRPTQNHNHCTDLANEDQEAPYLGQICGNKIREVGEGALQQWSQHLLTTIFESLCCAY